MGPESVVVTLSAVGLLAGLRIAALLHLKRGPLDEAGGDVAAADLSIVIPARNEAHNLPRLLESLTASSPPPGEIVVVDDGSTDDTAAIARSFGATVIGSDGLPDGWRGKTWACHQGAAAATGSHLLFLDADTWFEPEGLGRLLHRYRGGALSVGPFHAVERPYEQLSAFFNLCMNAGTLPHGLFGQVLLIDRASYETAGGHAAVRGKILENYHLAERLRARGTSAGSLPGRGMISFRMYPGGVAELIEGWTKGFASGAGKTPRVAMVTVAAWISGLMIPLVAMAFDPRALGIYAAYAVQTAWLLRLVGRFHPLTGLLYPLPLFFYFALLQRSARRSGKDVTWKGRVIRAD